jgi:hypothetical protein
MFAFGSQDQINASNIHLMNDYRVQSQMAFGNATLIFFLAIQDTPAVKLIILMKLSALFTSFS